MSEVRTSYGKGRDGWEAETIVPLVAPYELRITTSKRGRGGLSSIATRVKREPTRNGFSGFSFVVFGDFNKTIAEDRAARCTDESVTKLHGEALASIDTVFADCRAFYAAKGEPHHVPTAEGVAA